MNSFLRNMISKPTHEHESIIIVSGLPRSGTSMMMQMLKAGGISIVSDGVRKPDEDNLRGYYEFERVKKIQEEDTWLAECQGKAVKMVSALLVHLPDKYCYRVIFMKRKMSEILASQEAMLRRLGKNVGDVSDEIMAQKYEKHIQKIQKWLEAQRNVATMYISYNDILKSPVEKAKELAPFLGGQPRVLKMAGVVESSLYRQRENLNR